jgi:hypothetical protein
MMIIRGAVKNTQKQQQQQQVPLRYFIFFSLTLIQAPKAQFSIVYANKETLAEVHM